MDYHKTHNLFINNDSLGNFIYKHLGFEMEIGIFDVYFRFFSFLIVNIFRKRKELIENIDGSPMGNFHNSIRNHSNCTGGSVRQKKKKQQHSNALMDPVSNQNSVQHCSVSQFHPIQFNPIQSNYFIDIFHFFFFFFICREKEKKKQTTTQNDLVDR